MHCYTHGKDHTANQRTLSNARVQGVLVKVMLWLPCQFPLAHQTKPSTDAAPPPTSLLPPLHT